MNGATLEYLISAATGHPGWAVYAMAALLGGLPDVLALLRRGGGFGRGLRRAVRLGRAARAARALGGLAFLLLMLGPIVVLALIAVAFYAAMARRG
jgi:hypothetical protein